MPTRAPREEVRSGAKTIREKFPPGYAGYAIAARPNARVRQYFGEKSGWPVRASLVQGDVEQEQEEGGEVGGSERGQQARGEFARADGPSDRSVGTYRCSGRGETGGSGIDRWEVRSPVEAATRNVFF